VAVYIVAMAAADYWFIARALYWVTTLEARATYLLGLHSERHETAEINVVPHVRAEQSEADCQTLLERIAGGDSQALSDLFRRYGRLVHSVGRRILRDGEEAEDLVQEVFLYIHRKSSLFDSAKSSARSWIFQIVYTQAFLRRRHLKSHGFYASGIADRSLDPDPRTRSGAEYDQTVEGLFGKNGWRKILDALTQEQRETLRLHFFEGYTLAEIAEKLGQSYANIRNHHYRGLEKLRKHLAEDESSRR
jgi:RNA polymerase sigma-70 factor, ECF subfamily